MVGGDSTFFDVFPTPFIRGDAATALDRPENVVIDKTTAINYFGTEDALGKMIQVRDKQFQVTGRVRTFSAEHTLRRPPGIPISGIKQWYADWILTNASGTSLYTYIRVKDKFSTAGFEAAATKQVTNRWGWKGDGAPRYFLQPLTSIHLQSNFPDEISVNGNMITVYIFGTTAIGNSHTRLHQLHST